MQTTFNFTTHKNDTFRLDGKDVYLVGRNVVFHFDKESNASHSCALFQMQAENALAITDAHIFGMINVENLPSLARKATLIISKEINAFQLITENGQYTFEVNTSDSLNKSLYIIQGIFAANGVFARNYGGAKLIQCQALANSTTIDGKDVETIEGNTVAIVDTESFDRALQLIVGKYASTAIISKNLAGTKKIADAITAWHTFGK